MEEVLLRINRFLYEKCRGGHEGGTRKPDGKGNDPVRSGDTAIPLRIRPAGWCTIQHIPRRQRSSRNDDAGTIAIRSANLRRLGMNQLVAARQIPKPQRKSSMIASPISSMTSLRGHTSDVGSVSRDWIYEKRSRRELFICQGLDAGEFLAFQELQGRSTAG